MPKAHIPADIVLELLLHILVVQNLPEAVLNQVVFLHPSLPFIRAPMVTALVEILNQVVFPIHLILLQNPAVTNPAAALPSLMEIITMKAGGLFSLYQFPYPGDIVTAIMAEAVF